MKKIARTLKYELLYGLVISFTALTRRLPRQLALKLYERIGLLCYYILEKERKVTLKNLAFAFGKEKTAEERVQIAKNAWKNLAKSIMEFVRYKNIKSLDDYTKFIKIEGLEHLENAYKRGKGVVIMTSHFGPFEICLYVFALLGYNVASTGSPLKYEKLHKLLVENRSLNGAEYFERDKASIKMFRQLKNGHIMGLLIDQDTDKVQNTFIDFFGKKCATPIGPATLIAKTEASVVYLHCIRQTDDSFILEINSSIHFQTDDDLTAITQQLHNYTENIVKRYPDQWVWMHDRWKTRPEDIVLNNTTTS